MQKIYILLNEAESKAEQAEKEKRSAEAKLKEAKQKILNNAQVEARILSNRLQKFLKNLKHQV